MDTGENTYSNLLREFAQDWNLSGGRAIHASFIKGCLPLTLFLQNHLLNMYVKIGDLPSARKVFDEMPHRNVVSWSAVMAGLVRDSYASEALSLFSRMHHEGLTKPNEFTFVSILQACSLTENVTCAYQIHSLIVRSGLESNVFLLNAFLTALVRHGRLAEALQAFDARTDKDIVSWNTMMAVQVHGLLVKSGYGDDICVGNSLADMYIKCEKLVEGFRLLDEMPKKDVCSWSQIAIGCLQCGEPRKALSVIAQMMRVGVMPNEFTLATALNACASLASLKGGKQIHGLRIKLGIDIDVCVDNALLDMYAKSGCMDSAWDTFQSMNSRSVISWTTMIMACAQNGQPREALQVFDEMKKTENVEPNYITFICVLYACSQGGFVDEGWKYFFSMTKDHGILPGEDHYACMVNILGRAGLTKEARELIQRMPFEPGVLVWQTLLSACQIHGDLETGKLAAEHAMLKEYKYPSTYLLLSNMFAELRNWDGVMTLRQLMEQKGVKKVPGSSWIEQIKDIC
ncbi:hypothetical protein PIB30_023818 [Stylosanthes scabra]|uniref:Pentatricopeptide repeat-containing protein n=1 Tax=Stylosanthes scabra TaxID=79078 RepID=A0ABU6ZA13_9FABA|nr:hypothetical protein [Stylosanthes scabra]